VRRKFFERCDGREPHRALSLDRRLEGCSIRGVRSIAWVLAAGATDALHTETMRQTVGGGE
jgi:hypothetical protein